MISDINMALVLHVTIYVPILQGLLFLCVLACHFNVNDGEYSHVVFLWFFKCRNDQVEEKSLHLNSWYVILRSLWYRLARYHRRGDGGCTGHTCTHNFKILNKRRFHILYLCTCIQFVSKLLKPLRFRELRTPTLPSAYHKPAWWTRWRLKALPYFCVRLNIADMVSIWLKSEFSANYIDQSIVTFIRLIGG